MKILAFLQNPWFRPGTRPEMIKKYRIDVDFHRRVLYLSATGKALYRAFGHELYEQIIWENANPIHTDKRTGKMPPDYAHMAKMLVIHKPDLILCFGAEARRGMDKLMVDPWPNVLFAAHPMARGSAAQHLKKIVGEVKERVIRDNLNNAHIDRDLLEDDK